ncbi:MAG: hypothetical protein PHQ50_02605 [Eubacteriales bacterium]|nr:hypothetical protein [Eubacteriales bacterium]
MILKTAVKYRLLDSAKSIGLFYIILLALTVFIAGSAITFSTDTSSVVINVGGFEFATTIFVFVLAIASFRESFRMMLQNGLSRKSICLSLLISTGLISAVMSLLADFFNILGKLVSAGQPNLVFGGVMEHLYSARYLGEGHAAQIFAESFLFFFCLFAAVMTGGYFVSILFYRLNKGGKIAVAVAVPSFFIFILPIFDAVVTNGEIFRFLARTFLRIYGLDTANPYMGMLTLLAQGAICAGLSWILARKAIVKD